MFRIKAGTLNLCNGGCEVLIHSGTTFIIGPFSDVQRFQELIPTYNSIVTIAIKIHSLDHNEYLFILQLDTLDCSYRSSLSDLIFIVENQSLRLTTDQYIYSEIDSSNNNRILCHLAIRAFSVYTDHGDTLWKNEYSF